MKFTLEKLVQLPPEELSKVPVQEIFTAAQRASPEERMKAQKATVKREIMNENKIGYSINKIRNHYGNYSS